MTELPPGTDAFEMWRRLPWCDYATGNLSLTKLAASFALGYWCHVAEYSHTFNWPAVAVLGLTFMAMFSKTVSDFRAGAAVFFGRRSSDRVSGERPAVATREHEIL